MYTNLFWTKIKMSHSSKTFFTGHSSRANSSRPHCETRSIGQSNHLTGRIAMLKTELHVTAPRIFCLWERASEHRRTRKHGAYGSLCRQWHKNQSFYVGWFPSTEDLSWSNSAVRTVSIQDDAITPFWFLAWLKNCASRKEFYIPTGYSWYKFFKSFSSR